MRALEGRCKELKLLLFSFSTAAAVGVCTGLRPFLVFEGELSGAGKTVSRFTSTLRRATTFTDNESTSKMNGDDTAKSKKAFLKFVWIDRPFRSTDKPNRFRTEDWSTFLKENSKGYNFLHVIENPFFLNRNMSAHHTATRKNSKNRKKRVVKRIPSQPQKWIPKALAP